MGILDRLRAREGTTAIAVGDAHLTPPPPPPYELTAARDQHNNRMTIVTHSSTPAAAAIGQTPLPKTPQRASFLKLRSRSTASTPAEAAALDQTASTAMSPTKMYGTNDVAREKTRSFASSSSLSSRFTSDSRRYNTVSGHLWTDLPELPVRNDSLYSLAIGKVNDHFDSACVQMPHDTLLAHLEMSDSNATVTARRSTKKDELAVRNTRSAMQTDKEQAWDEEDRSTLLGRRRWRSTLLKSKRPQTADAARASTLSSTKPKLTLHPRRSIDDVRQDTTDAHKPQLSFQRDLGLRSEDDDSKSSCTYNTTAASERSVARRTSHADKSVPTAIASDGPSAKSPRLRSGTISASTYILRQLTSQANTESKSPTRQPDLPSHDRTDADSTASMKMQETVDRLLTMDGSHPSCRAQISIITAMVRLLAGGTSRPPPPPAMKTVGKKTRIALARPHTASGVPTVPSVATTSSLEIAMCQLEGAVMSRIGAMTSTCAARPDLIDHGFQLDSAFEHARESLGLDPCTRHITSALLAFVDAKEQHECAARMPPAAANVALRPAPRRVRSRVNLRRAESRCYLSRRTTSPDRPFHTPTLMSCDGVPSPDDVQYGTYLGPGRKACSVLDKMPSSLSIVSVHPLTPVTPSTDRFSGHSITTTSISSSPSLETGSSSESGQSVATSSHCQVLTPEAFSTRSSPRRRRRLPQRSLEYRPFATAHIRAPSTQMLTNC